MTESLEEVLVLSSWEYCIGASKERSGVSYERQEESLSSASRTVIWVPSPLEDLTSQMVNQTTKVSCPLVVCCGPPRPVALPIALAELLRSQQTQRCQLYFVCTDTHVEENKENRMSEPQGSSNLPQSSLETHKSP